MIVWLKSFVPYFAYGLCTLEFFYLYRRLGGPALIFHSLFVQQ